MIQNIEFAISVLLRWFVIYLFIYDIYLAVPEVWNQIKPTIQSLNAAVMASLITVSGTVTVALLTVFGTKLLESRAKIREEHSNKKRELYENILNFMFEVLFSHKSGKKIRSENVAKFLQEINGPLIAWGSITVIDSFVKFRNTAMSQTPEAMDAKNPDNIIFSLENLMREIRKDLGHADKSIKRGQLLSLFVNDPNLQVMK